MSGPRDDGIVIGTLEPGPRNSIADVGVTVGHVTVERTGVTAVVPPSLPLVALMVTTLGEALRAAAVMALTSSLLLTITGPAWVVSLVAAQSEGSLLSPTYNAALHQVSMATSAIRP